MTEPDKIASAEPSDVARKWPVVAVLVTGAFMALLDANIVNIVLPIVRAKLGLTPSMVQLVVAGYALAYGALLITGGRLGDVFGQKRVFLTGVCGFLAASLACGSATSGWLLVGARVAQGVFAAIMYPQILAIIQIVFRPEERARPVGILGVVLSVAGVVGPTLAGILTDINIFGLGWRVVFLVNLPIGAILIPAGLRVLPLARRRNRTRLDISGVALLGITLLFVTYPLLSVSDGHYPPGLIAGMITVGLLALAGTIILESAKERCGEAPLIPMSIFHKSGFRGDLIAYGAVYASIIAFFVFVPFFLESGLRYSPLLAGLTTLPFALGAGIASFLASRASYQRRGAWILTGSAMCTVGVATTLLIIDSAASVNIGTMAPGLFVMGAGFGAMLVPMIVRMISFAGLENAGAASGVITTVQQVGGALGVALAGIAFFTRLADVSATSSARYEAAFHQALAVCLVASGVNAVLLWSSAWLRTHQRAHVGSPS